MVVRVVKGDFLGRIVRRRYGSAGPGVLEAVKRANPDLTNPDLLSPGQTIVLPGDLVLQGAAAGTAASGTAGDTQGAVGESGSQGQ
jgi:phage tail protein X